MYVQIETSKDQKPIVRIILDWDEKEPRDLEPIRKLLMDASLCVPKDRSKWIRLEKPKGS